MNFFPNGFLATMYCLRGVAPSVYAEVKRPTDQNDVVGGELIILPEKSLEGAAPARFVGLETLGETSVGMVAETSGAELFEECQRAAIELGDDSGELGVELFRQSIALSSRIQALNMREGLVRILHDGGPVLATPSGERLALQPVG